MGREILKMEKIRIFFFKEVDGRILGLLRIIFYLTVLAVFGGMSFTNLCSLPSGLKTHLTVFNSVNDYFLNPIIMRYLLIIWKISLALSTLGFISALSMPIAFVSSGILFSLHNAYSCGFHGTNILFLTMGILMLSDAGKYISIDSFINKKRIVLKKTPVWPIRLVQINFVIMFFSGAVAKYIGLGFDYITGDAFYSVLLIRKTWGGNLSLFFETLLDHPILARLCGAYSFITELLCPLALFNFLFMRIIIISLGIMQILIYFNMGISSFNAMIALYLFWFNWEKVLQLYDKKYKIW